MCLAIPGRVVRWLDSDPLMALAEVEFGGIVRQCHMACVPEARAGDYVVVHAGVAIARLDEVAAQRTLAELASLPEETEWPAHDFEDGEAR
jgi:hydrogenase expression/formation protein HypC